MPFSIIIFFTYSQVCELQTSVLKLLLTPLSPPLKCNFFLCIPRTFGFECGAVNVSTENTKYYGRKCFVIAKDDGVPQSLLEQYECQQKDEDEEEMERQEKVCVGIEGK